MLTFEPALSNPLRDFRHFSPEVLDSLHSPRIPRMLGPDCARIPRVGRISIRRPSGSASVQLGLGVRPRDAPFAPRLLDGAQVLVGQLLVVIKGSVELGNGGVLGTPK